MPQISVIIPVHNVANYLPRCLESLLGQTFTDNEIILIENGSSDATLEIAHTYAQRDSRIQVFHLACSSVCKARNLGIDKARSPYIVFFDSDDWAEPTYLADFFSHNAQPEKTLVFQDQLLDYSEYKGKDTSFNRPFFGYKDGVYHQGDDTAILYAENFLFDGCVTSKLLNTSIINENNIRFNPQISTREDHIFMFEYLQYVDTFEWHEQLNHHYMQRANQSLSKKLHAVEEQVMAVNLLEAQIPILLNRFDLKDEAHVQKLYSFLIVNTLRRGSDALKWHNRKLLFDSIRQRSEAILKINKIRHKKYFQRVHKLLQIPEQLDFIAYLYIRAHTLYLQVSGKE